MSIAQKLNTGLRDTLGRQARYLRISITDRCNLDCFYCRDPRKSSFIPHQKILRYEEISRFTHIMKKMGIRKIRVTGGEPFIRKNCTAFLLHLRKNFPDLSLNITTNGVLLEPWITDLVKAAPDAINISLDSFIAETFKKVTGHDKLTTVLNNIDRLLSKNMRIKLNAVAIRGITDREVDNFLYAVKNMPVDLRFIEFMPMGVNTRWTEEMFLPAEELKKLINEKVGLQAANASDPLRIAGPARMFDFKGARGRLGFITALSNHFCSQCNRLRLTSDGKLRTCLFSDREYALSHMLRNTKVSDEAIGKTVRAAHTHKPIGADLLKMKKDLAVASKNMTGIGG